MERRIWLVYERVDGKFRIAVRTRDVYIEYGLDCPNESPEEIKGESLVAWVSAPRDLKLRTFKHLPALLKSVGDEAASLAADTKTTVEAVENVLKALGKSEG